MKSALVLMIFLSLQVRAAETPQKAPEKKSKSQFNTQIYEQTSEEGSLSGVVKVVREIQGETEVIFEGQSGFYSVAPGVSGELLLKSQKTKTPVTVKINKTSRQILKINAQE